MRNINYSITDLTSADIPELLCNAVEFISDRFDGKLAILVDDENIVVSDSGITYLSGRRNQLRRGEQSWSLGAIADKVVEMAPVNFIHTWIDDGHYIVEVDGHLFSTADYRGCRSGNTYNLVPIKKLNGEGLVCNMQNKSHRKQYMRWYMATKDTRWYLDPTNKKNNK